MDTKKAKKIEKRYQLSKLLFDDKPETIFKETKKIFHDNYREIQLINHLEAAFSIIKQLFNGELPGYQAYNTLYHDLEHTMETLLASVRLLDGYNLSNPKLPGEQALHLLIASLFHDTGYIQESEDILGTGARYTKNHVQRSVDFLEKQYAHNQLVDTNSIARMIRATDHNSSIDSIPFAFPREKTGALIVATADLLGQMSNRSYLEKLPLLFYEFKEANVPGFNTRLDIYKSTFDFYKFAKKKFVLSYENTYQYARKHFAIRCGIDMNLYTRAIKRQILYLDSIVKEDSRHFHLKLRRGGIFNKKNSFRRPAIRAHGTILGHSSAGI
ncbi:MAG: HD domain-containing protein [bacterium]|nr:HD domain-containing protein [bacterium]